MSFPWEALLPLFGFVGVVLLFMLAPAILGSLIGQIIRFFKSLFSGKDDDDI